MIVDVLGYYEDHVQLESPVASGQIRGSGTIRTGTPNVASVLHPAVGAFCVIFDPPLEQGRLERAVISGAGDSPIVGMHENTVGGADACTGAPNGGGLQVKIFNLAGDPADTRFSFIVP